MPEAETVDAVQGVVGSSSQEEQKLKETLLNIGMAVAILGGSYAIMHFFARAMYLRCGACATLNARRRTNCRACENPLR